MKVTGKASDPMYINVLPAYTDLNFTSIQVNDTVVEKHFKHACRQLTIMETRTSQSMWWSKSGVGLEAWSCRQIYPVALVQHLQITSVRSPTTLKAKSVQWPSAWEMRAKWRPKTLSRPNHTRVKALHTHKHTHIHMHTKPTNLPGEPASCHQQDWLGQAKRHGWGELWFRSSISQHTYQMAWHSAYLTRYFNLNHSIYTGSANEWQTLHVTNSRSVKAASPKALVPTKPPWRPSSTYASSP